MDKQQKFEFVEKWSEEMKNVPFAVLVDYRGLSVAEVTDLRSKVRESSSSYQVVKNNLARKALPGTPLEGLAEHFVGPTAIAYNAEDPVVIAKVLVDFAKANEKLEIKAGMIDGQFLDAEGVRELSKMPGREELLSKLLYLLQYPIQGFACALSNITGDLAKALGQVAKNKEQE